MSLEKAISPRLPVYSKEEEVVHVVSHSLGIVLGFAMIIVTIFNHKNITQLISGLIFGLSLVFLYAISTTYHGLSSQGKELSKKKALQIADHSSVPLLIMGTLVPFALCLLEPARAGFGWIILIITSLMAITIITLNFINLERYKVINTIGYFVLGGSILVGSEIIFNSLGTDGFILLISGGLAYILGAVFYGFGGTSNNFKKMGITKQKWMHAVFHVFCIIGSVLHCVCVYMYVFVS